MVAVWGWPSKAVVTCSLRISMRVSMAITADVAAVAAAWAAWSAPGWVSRPRGAECGADLRCTFVDRPPTGSFECGFDLGEGQFGGPRRSGQSRPIDECSVGIRARQPVGTASHQRSGDGSRRGHRHSVGLPDTEGPGAPCAHPLTAAPQESLYQGLPRLVRCSSNAVNIGAQQALFLHRNTLL